MVIALYQAADYWRMSVGFKGFALVKIVLRDQFLYFMLYVCFKSATLHLSSIALNIQCEYLLHIRYPRVPSDGLKPFHDLRPDQPRKPFIP